MTTTSTIHLSCLMLDPMSRRVQNEMADPYQMHRTLCHAFPGLSDEEWQAARVLFRVDADRGPLQLLVQSKIEPDWSAFTSHIEGRRYLLGAPKVTQWEPSFQSGQSLRFRLLANPTFRPGAQGAPRQKNLDRVGLYQEHERLDWLLHRGRNEYGFALATQSVTLRARQLPDGGTKPIRFRGREHQVLDLDLPCVDVDDANDGKRFPLPSSRSQFSAARFDGVLQVTDAAKFLHAIERGVGPGRGFGFGLLSVARAS